METLLGKKVLVTGGAARLGRAAALACARAHLHTAIHFHASAGPAATTTAAIRDLGVETAAFQADLSDPAQAESLMEAAVATFGLPDYLVCCHGGYGENTLFDMTLSRLLEETILTGISPLLLCRAWVRAGGRGAVVHLLDARMTDNDRSHAAYQAAKRMLYAAVRTSAVELAPHVRVNGVAPGLVLPPSGADEAYIRRVAGAAPLQRIGTSDAVGRAVLFLLESNFITGQVLYADGGRNLVGSIY